jgi:hypothetical protein
MNRRRDDPKPHIRIDPSRPIHGKAEVARVGGVPLGMCRIHPECPESDPPDRSVPADFLLRQERDEEDDEEEDDGNGNGKEDDDDDVCSKARRVQWQTGVRDVR